MVNFCRSRSKNVFMYIDVQDEHDIVCIYTLSCYTAQKHALSQQIKLVCSKSKIYNIHAGIQLHTMSCIHV